MGTRSLTYFKTGHKAKDGRTMACFYRQYDGYPSGHGLELAEFLAPFTVVNGYSNGMEAGTHANGMGCLAAQAVAHFKKDIGGIYMQATDEPADCGQDYEYHVYPDHIQVFECYSSRKCIFTGSWDRFLEFCKKAD